MSDLPAAGSLSLSRVFKLVLPLALILIGVSLFTNASVQKQAQAELERDILQRLLDDVVKPPNSTVAFVDADGDLVCDSPADDKCVDPATIKFCYIPSEDSSREATNWADLCKYLSEKLGKPVEYDSKPTSISEQLSALAAGELHITGLSTGSAPTAVKNCGFIPVCTFGRADGTVGYTMKIIAPAGSAIKSAEDLKPSIGKRPQVTFTSPDSNSGFKAALVMLMEQRQLLPERDYDWGFSLGHDTSIKSIVAKESDLAPIASDVLEGMIAKGEVAADAFQTVYESERFPPAVLGYAGNLKPELRTAIREALLAFDWTGTSVANEYATAGNTKFVAVNYKDDWANTRRIDDIVRKAREKK